MKNIFFIALVASLLVACNQPITKKVVIMGRGKLAVQGNEITLKEGSGYAEETVEVKEKKSVAWNINTPSGTTTVNVPEEPGTYVLNLKTDTIVGSQQIMGQDLGGRTMSQEELKVKIDSLGKLTTGSNVLAGGHNYFIVPNELKKISSSLEARIFGPYTKIPSAIEADKKGNTPEIYKFYTNAEVRDLIGKLKKLTF